MYLLPLEGVRGEEPSLWEGLGGLFRLLFLHISLDSQANHLCLCVAANGDGLSEVTRELTSTVVCHVDSTLLARLNRSLCVGRNRTTATCYSLIDNKRLVTRVSERESTLHDRIRLRELSKVMRSLIKLNLYLS